MYDLPEPTPTAPAAGQADNPLTDSVMQAAVRDFITQTSYRNNDPDVPSHEDGPRVGTTPPVQQPGIPAMSARTTEITRSVMYASMATVPPGLIAVAVMVASEHANPTVIGMICAAPAAIAVPILALARLFRSAKEAEPDVHHHSYSGPVYQDQRNVHSSTRGVWAKTNNQQ
jgi:hypothetical protein